MCISTITIWAHSIVDSESDDDQLPPPPPSDHRTSQSTDDEDTGETGGPNDAEWDDFLDAVEENDAEDVELILDDLPQTSRDEVRVLLLNSLT